MSQEEKKFADTCRDHFAGVLANISEAKPNDLSILFAVADFIWTQSQACAPFVEDSNEDWPCNFTYKSEVRGYRYHNRVLEMSILTENNVNNFPEYHYMCFSVSRIL